MGYYKETPLIIKYSRHNRISPNHIANDFSKKSFRIFRTIQGRIPAFNEILPNFHIFFMGLKFFAHDAFIERDGAAVPWACDVTAPYKATPSSLAPSATIPIWLLIKWQCFRRYINYGRYSLIFRHVC